MTFPLSDSRTSISSAASAAPLTSDPVPGRARDIAELAKLPRPPNRLVGREQEVANVVALLSEEDCRLVTLTGPGGVGKTRVALEAANVIQRSVERDVIFVSLEAITHPDQIGLAIGQAAGLAGILPETLPERLSTTMGNRQLLLVLDNFEHMLIAAPWIAELATACPTLQLLVTSRAPLRLTLEQVVDVPPLDLPLPDAEPVDARESSSVRLFLDRSMLSPCDLDDAVIASISAVCRRIDGLPLAIELAAARTRILAPVEMLERMNRTLPFLAEGPRDAPERLQTMRNAIAWSYDLLSPSEQALFRELSVFQGGFTLKAAEDLASDEPGIPALTLTESLAQYGLIQRAGSALAPARFTMLETIREFGLEALREVGEEEHARSRHLDFFTGQLPPANWFEARGVPPFGLPGEQDNLRSALSWANETGRNQDAGVVAHGLVSFWRRSGLFTEGATCLSRIGEACRLSDPMISAGAFNASAQFLYQLGDLTSAEKHASTSLEVCRHAHEQAGIRLNLRILGMVATFTDGARALTLLNEAMEISQRLAESRHYALDLRQRVFTRIVLGQTIEAATDLAEALPLHYQQQDFDTPIAFALAMKAWIAALEGDLDVAERAAEETMALARAAGLVECQSFCHRVLGIVALDLGRHAVALAHFQDALRLVHRSGLQLWEGFCLAEVAAIAQASLDFERAALLFGAADSIWTRLGFSAAAKRHSTWVGRIEPSQYSLASEDFAGKFKAGALLSRQSSYELAMSTQVRPPPRDGAPSPLSSREAEVLSLMAEGFTNREIAETLFISKRTVDSHVLSILSKLGAESRRSAVSLARERRLLSPAS